MYSRYDPSQCARCNKLHTCTGTPHCPCFDMVVPEVTLEYISDHYEKCLCTACMEELRSKTKQIL